jgi:hypothetical protein
VPQLYDPLDDLDPKSYALRVVNPYWMSTTTHPNPAQAQPHTGSPPVVNYDPDDFDAKEWIMRNIYPDDPVELRCNDLRGGAESAGFQNIDVGNLGEPDFWQMRFDRGTNDECTTAAQIKRWIGFIARGCQCQIAPGQFVVILEGDRIAARFRLRPRPQPEPQ